MTSSPGAPPSVWLNGTLVRAEEARVSPFDHGLLVGDGVFETMRVYRGVPFAWRRHLERLAHSATGLGLPLPDAQLLRVAVDAVLTANGIAEGRVRITVTGGVSPLGSERAETATTVLVAASELATWPERPEVVIVPWRRNDRGAVTGLKTISYAENVRALAYARDAARPKRSSRTRATSSAKPRARTSSWSPAGSCGHRRPIPAVCSV